MIKIVENFLKKYNLNSPEKTFLVGFSGGYDSLCLLDILNIISKKNNFKVVAMHLNHNWRGEESIQDEINCKMFCEKNSIDFVSETLAENQPKTENYAREARYDFFIRTAKNYDNSVIFTAHTQSDNAETLIYRIAKGTGITGLQGILPERKINGYSVYRPLLGVSRAQIEDYCMSKGLVANNDSSNLDTNYKRNFIRHKVMPLLKELNFSAEKAIVSLAKIATSQSRIVEEYLNIVKKDLYLDDKILTEKFRVLSPDVMQKLVYDMFLAQKLDYDSKKIINILEFIKENFDSKSGSRCSLASNLWVFASSKYIYLITRTKGVENKTEISITQEGAWDFGSGRAFSLQKYLGEDIQEFPSENAPLAYVNLSDTGVELTLRTRRDGDFIIPFGMQGKMKLKKYLNAKRISQHEKNGLILLCKGSEVLWVVGVGLSNRLKVQNKPTHVLALVFKSS